MTNLKKVLSAVLSATVLVASGAMMASAEDQSLISMDPADWVYEEDVMKLESTDGALVLYNTDGQWPQAVYTGDPITIASTAKISYDFTLEAGANTNILFFFKDSTADAFNEGEYVRLPDCVAGLNTDAGSGDIIGDGSAIKGELDVSKIPESCYNEDGTLTLNCIKIFASGDANKKLTIRDLSVSTDGSSNNGGDSTTTTAAGNNGTTTTTKKTNPSTGESTAMVASGVVLAVVAAGAVVLTAKKKNH